MTLYTGRRRSRSSRLRRRPRRSSRRRSRGRWLIAALAGLLGLMGLALVASILLGFNPLLERQLRAQFGDAFFSDFNVSAPAPGDDEYEAIVERYEPVFEDLEDEALQRLEHLFQNALDEYHREEKSGTLDQFRLTNKYIQAGRILEKNVDETFDSLLAAMERELTAHEHPTDILDEARETYDEAKEAKKRELLGRLRREIGG